MGSGVNTNEIGDMKLRNGAFEVFLSGMLKSDGMMTGVGKKRSLGRLSKHGGDLNTGRQL